MIIRTLKVNLMSVFPMNFKIEDQGNIQKQMIPYIQKYFRESDSDINQVEQSSLKGLKEFIDDYNKSLNNEYYIWLNDVFKLDDIEYVHFNNRDEYKYYKDFLSSMIDGIHQNFPNKEKISIIVFDLIFLPTNQPALLIDSSTYEPIILDSQ